MSVDRFIGLTPILINLVVATITIIVNGLISKHTIDTNRKLNAENAKINAENAGRNRIIYGAEVMNLEHNDVSKKNLKEKLDTGDYTILNAYANLSSWGHTVIVLGKINP